MLVKNQLKIHQFITLLKMAKINDNSIFNSTIDRQEFSTLIKTAYNDVKTRRLLPLIYSSLIENKKLDLLSSEIVTLLKQTNLQALINYSQQSEFIKRLVTDLEDWRLLAIYIRRNLSGLVSTLIYL
jgi:hypothetical protein